MRYSLRKEPIQPHIRARPGPRTTALHTSHTCRYTTRAYTGLYSQAKPRRRAGECGDPGTVNTPPRPPLSSTCTSRLPRALLPSVSVQPLRLHEVPQAGGQRRDHSTGRGVAALALTLCLCLCAPPCPKRLADCARRELCHLVRVRVRVRVRGSGEGEGYG